MADEVASRDANDVPTLLAVSSADGRTVIKLYADPTTHRLLVDIAGGSGDVSGPGSSTQDALARWDNTLGTLLADSTVTLSDGGILAPVTSDTAVLGSTTKMWSDLFLASGAVINFNNGNMTITHSAGVLTFAGGTVVLGTATATTINGLTITTTNGTLTLANGSSLITSGANSITFTSTGATNVTLPTSGTLMTNPMTTGGDIIYGGASGVPTRLANGSAGQVLQSNGTTLAPSWAAAPAATLVVGTTTITSGTDTRILYDNAGVLGEYTLTGTGTVVAMQTSPVFVTGITTPQVLASANDSGALGASGTAFADLFLASGGVINWAAGNATIVHTSGLLTTNVPVTITGVATADGFAPTSTTATGNRMYLPAANTLGFAINGTGEVQITATAFSPVADGGNSLGTTALGWQNLFGNTGFVINFENGDWVATHTAGILTVGTGDLRVTTAGTNTASVVTVGGTQTLTAKTLTSPSITTATLSGVQLLAEGASIGLDPTLSADGTWSGVTITGTAGATLAFGDLIYLAVADSRWELTDADAVATAGNIMIGICVLAAAADGDPTTILLQGNIRADTAFPALTVGAAVYVGETAGDVQVAIPTGADNVIRVVGFALTADSMYFNPSQDHQTTVA